MYAYARARTKTKQASAAPKVATRQAQAPSSAAPAAFRMRTRQAQASPPAPTTFRTRTRQAQAPSRSAAAFEALTRVRQAKSASHTLSAGSAGRTGITVHRVRLGPKVLKIRVARSQGVQIGDRNRQLNHYRYRFERPRVSLDGLFKGHPARLRSFARLVKNPHSRAANSAFRRQLSAGPSRPSRVRFADPARAGTVRIRARVDEHGALVVDRSRGVQVGDRGTMRNTFNYKMAGREISVERMLRDRPGLTRDMAMAARHPDNRAVQRSFTRQISREYTRGHEPSLRVLSRDWPGSGLSVERAAGVQLGTGNIRTDRVSVKVGQVVLRGWDSPALKRTATRGDEPTPARRTTGRPMTSSSRSGRRAADSSLRNSRMEPRESDRPNLRGGRGGPGGIGRGGR
jgi:hypothetical protein